VSLSALIDSPVRDSSPRGAGEPGLLRVARFARSDLRRRQVAPLLEREQEAVPAQLGLPAPDPRAGLLARAQDLNLPGAPYLVGQRAALDRRGVPVLPVLQRHRRGHSLVAQPASPRIRWTTEAGA